jgi:glycosyltransferase involved in cell wall biosynthesis
MAERSTIGILFSVSDGWIGGSYYFLNIIAAINNLPDEKKPILLIYSSDTSGYEAAKKIGYPYLLYKNSAFKYSLIERVINKASRLLFKQNIIVKGLSEKEMPVLFGYYEQLMFYKCKRKVYWIPDFQEHYYPDFLGEDIVLDRRKKHLELIRRNAEFVFSSESALNDFNSIYPKNSCKISVVKFAVTHTNYDFVDIKKLQGKYNFKDSYFFTPNQFWAHKNHLIILKALVVLKKEGVFVQFLFSGKLNENDSHVKRLFAFIKENDLDKQIVFLGFIAREEQLCIMKNAIAVVQPSLFEGWSTVVEDAKAMGKYIVASDLVVHQEQILEDNVAFFNPFDEHDLSGIIKELISINPKDVKINYQDKINAFAKDFLEAMD